MNYRNQIRLQTTMSETEAITIHLRALRPLCLRGFFNIGEEKGKKSIGYDVVFSYLRVENKAEIMNHSFDFMSNKERLTVAKTLINHKENHIHNIENVIICKYNGFFIGVNTSTLMFKCFETEEEAVNFTLDFFKFLKGEQLEIEIA